MPCQNGTCEDLVNEFNCHCSVGYTGTFCEIGEHSFYSSFVPIRFDLQKLMNAIRIRVRMAGRVWTKSVVSRAIAHQNSAVRDAI